MVKKKVDELVDDSALPRARRRNPLIITLIVLVSIVVAAVVTVSILLLTNVLTLSRLGLVGTQQTTTSQNSGDLFASLNEQNKSVNEAKKEFAKGEDATFAQYRVVVNSINLTYTPLDDSQRPAEGKKYIALNLTVTNNSERNQSVSPYLFSLMDAENRVYATNFENDTPLEAESLGRGNSVTGNVFYEVGQDAQNFTLLYEASTYRNGLYAPVTYSLEL